MWQIYSIIALFSSTAIEYLLNISTNFLISYSQEYSVHENNATYKDQMYANIKNAFLKPEICPHCLLELSVNEFKLLESNSILLSGLTIQSDKKNGVILPVFEHIKFGINVNMFKMKDTYQKRKVKHRD